MNEMARYDERDTIFARMNYEVDSPEYCDYYSRHPELKEVDDELRGKPDLCDSSAPSYDPIEASEVRSNFSLIEELRSLCEYKPSTDKLHVEPSSITDLIKLIAHDFGADLVGVAEIKPEFYYSYRGRHKEHYGEEISELLPYGIVFAVEMKREMIDTAPAMTAMVESSRTYLKAATIGLGISYFLRGLGYSARNHMDGNYLAILPLVAVAAGLGVFGRHGLLISDRFGPRIKLGLVTTDLTLRCSQPLNVDLERFCGNCGLCSKECPTSAIPGNGRELVNGIKRWRINHELCYSYWRSNGTDCGICMKVCPFSKGIGFSQFSKSPDRML